MPLKVLLLFIFFWSPFVISGMSSLPPSATGGGRAFGSHGNNNFLRPHRRVSHHGKLYWWCKIKGAHPIAKVSHLPPSHQGKSITLSSVRLRSKSLPKDSTSYQSKSSLAIKAPIPSCSPLHVDPHDHGPWACLGHMAGKYRSWTKWVQESWKNSRGTRERTSGL